jgi:hypothetical protein
LFFDELGKKLQIKTLDDWYKISTEDIVQNGGGRIFYYYGNSLIKGRRLLNTLLTSLVLKAIYPEHQWKGYKFTSSSQYRPPLENTFLSSDEFINSLAKGLSEDKTTQKADESYQVFQEYQTETSKNIVSIFYDDLLTNYSYIIC